jgi:hypothetical protein
VILIVVLKVEETIVFLSLELKTKTSKNFEFGGEAVGFG